MAVRELWIDPCPMCNQCHRTHEPHDKNDPGYIALFNRVNHRDPTWEDAMAHCTEEVKEGWRASIARAKKTTAKLKEDTW